MSAHAASGHNHLAGDPPRVVGGEKGDDRRNILHLPDAPEWRLLFIHVWKSEFIAPAL